MSFTEINELIIKYFYYILLGLLLLNFVAGRKGAPNSKRKPVFFMALVFFMTMVIAVLTVNKGLPEFLPLAFFGLNLLLGSTVYRHVYFPYKFKCESCGASLSANDIFIDDGYYCSSCKPSDREKTEGADGADPAAHDEGESPKDS